MSTACFPMTAVPATSRLYRDCLAPLAESTEPHGWYGAGSFGSGWMHARAADAREDVRREELADLLYAQALEFRAGEAALANIGRLRAGARAVVTGQQVGLFGGPLLTLLKAATAVARAREATAATGVDHVPVFWLATEDHDLAEVDQCSLPTKGGVETLRLGLAASLGEPGGGAVGGLRLTENAAQRDQLEEVLRGVEERLGHAEVCEWLREAYTPEATLGGAFGGLMSRVFAAQGLVVMDATGAGFHRLGAPVLRYAIEHAAELERALLARTGELEAAGYHAQVLVAPDHSLLFLFDEKTGVRQALRRTQDGGWKAGGRAYRTADLLRVLEEQPERISPNALLRPVFQDVILPTAAYVGGPAEIAYFAQSEVLYRAILGRVTPVLPRFSATLIEPAVAAVLDRYEVQLPDVWTTPDALAQRLGARSMPIELKRKLAGVGNALDIELTAMTEYVMAMDAGLGRSAAVSASKMRYQMNRLRRMSAKFTLEKEAGLTKKAELLSNHLYPEGHLQERLLAGVWFLAQGGEQLVERLVAEAAEHCTGHAVVRL